MKKLILLFIFLLSWSGFSADKTVAFVGNTPIFESEVNFTMITENIPYQIALQNLIERKLLIEKAKKETIEVKEEEIEEEIKKIKNSFPDEKSFLDNLYKSGMTLADLKTLIKEKITVRKFIEKHIISRIKISPSEIADFIQKHSKLKKYRFRFLWFENREKGKEFLKNPDIEKMEESGYISEDEILPQILSRLENLQKGQFSDVFQVNNKYIIVYLEDVKVEEISDLKTLYKKARQQIYTSKYRELYKNLINQLRDEIPVVIVK